MENWKTHVRSQLLHRDHKEKHPFVGIFTTLSQLEEKFEFRQQILADVSSKSLEKGGIEVEKNSRLIQLQLRESEHLADKLSQTVSDLTTVLYLKEAELQYWQSCVSKYRQEALALAKRSNDLKTTLSEFEFIMETQSKEISTLQLQQKDLSESFAQTQKEKESLLQRWIKEKTEEAERVNHYNDTQERWQHLAKKMKKHLQMERRKGVSCHKDI